MRRVNSFPVPPEPPPRQRGLGFRAITLILGWIVANILSELLEELTFFLEPVFALTQWAILKVYLRRIDGWIIASLSGWLVIVILFYLGGFAEILNDSLANGMLRGWPPQFVLAGSPIATQPLILKTLLRTIEWALIGGCQGFVLQRIVHQAWLWLPVSAVAGALRGLTGVVCDQMLGGLWGVFLAPLVYGLVTGIILVLLLQIPPRVPPKRQNWLSNALNESSSD